MLRRIPRFLRVSVLVAVVLAAAVSVFQSWSSDTPGTGGWTQTQWGPLGPADRDLLAKVRMADLWEVPTGQQAAQQATSPAVREVGQHIASEHATLDADVRSVADKLGVLLPTSPSAQQQAWMQEISAQTGSDYDRTFVQRLRQAHGTVLALVAQVRAGTRNSLIRDFATTANEFVSRHLAYLESTGLVDYSALPAPPSPGLLSGATSWTDLIVPLLVFIAALLAAVGLVLALRRRTASRPRRVTVARQAVPVARPAPPVEPAAVPALAIPAPRASPEEVSGPHGLAPPAADAPRRRLAPGEFTGPHRLLPNGETTGSHRVDSHRVDSHRVDSHRVDSHRVDSHRVDAPTGRSTRRTVPAPGESTGPLFRRVEPAPGENTGSHRTPVTPRGTPVDTTGPRHSVRR
jgi:predicted outer membrane protein